MSLVVDKILRTEGSDEVGIGNIYFIVFHGETVAPFTSDLNVIGFSSDSESSDNGETHHTDVRIATANPDGVSMVMMVEENQSRDIAGRGTIGAWKTQTNLVWKSTMLGMVAGSIDTNTESAKETGFTAIQNALYGLASDDMSPPKGDDDVIDIKRVTISQFGQSQTISFRSFSDQDTTYDVTFKLSFSEIGTAVSSGADRIDLFASDDSRAYLASWDQQSADGKWEGWTPLGSNPRLSSPITAVSRSETHLDLFGINSEGKIYTATRTLQTDEAGAPTDETWTDWSRILDEVAAPGTSVSAVSRAEHHLDVFVVGTDGGVYTATWEPDSNQWRGWSRILDKGVAAPGTSVSAVSRAKHYLDVFVVGEDGGVYTATWEPDSGQWRGWSRIRERIAATSVSAVSRAKHHLDVFVVGEDGGVYTAEWEPPFEDKPTFGVRWKGWSRIIDKGVATPSASVTAVSRAKYLMDVFVLGNDGGIYTAAWKPNPGWEPSFFGRWRDPSRILNATAAPESSISVVARGPKKLDLFMLGQDGGIWTAAWDQDAAHGEWLDWSKVL